MQQRQFFGKAGARMNDKRYSAVKQGQREWRYVSIDQVCVQDRSFEISFVQECERLRCRRYCSMLLSGYAYRHKVAGNGGRQIFSIHMKGDIIDLHNSLLKRADHNIQALTAVEMALIPVQSIRQLAITHPQVGQAMWYETLVDAAVFREWTLDVGRRDGRTRTAHMLCEFGVRLRAAGLGSQDQYDLPMTQEQLADALALTTVHVNRTLKGLERDGLIQRNKRALRVINFAELASVGDFDDAYLHLDRATEV